MCGSSGSAVDAGGLPRCFDLRNDFLTWLALTEGFEDTP
jgi:hypothetical protein